MATSAASSGRYKHRYKRKYIRVSLTKSEKAHINSKLTDNRTWQQQITMSCRAGLHRRTMLEAQQEGYSWGLTEEEIQDIFRDTLIDPQQPR